MITIRLVVSTPPGEAEMKRRRSSLEAQYRKEGISARVFLYRIIRENRSLPWRWYRRG